METEEITIQSLAEEKFVTIDYRDDDIIIIDNVKTLVEPSATRIQMNFIAVCTHGKAQADLNGQTVALGENMLLICPPGVTFTNFLFSHDFEFKAIFLTTHILQALLREKMSIWNKVMYIHRMHVVTMTEEDIQFLIHFYGILRLCIDNSRENPYRVDVIQSIISGALLGLCGSLKQKVPAPQETETGEHYFQRFLDILSHNTQKHQPVEYYASELCITPKYLSSICKRNSGKTAYEWITEYVVADIEYFLRQTQLSTKQVSDQLNFPNTSFFGRYVKKHFGCTPRQLRQR